MSSIEERLGNLERALRIRDDGLIIDRDLVFTHGHGIKIMTDRGAVELSADPLAAREIVIPDASGTLALTGVSSSSVPDLASAVATILAIPGLRAFWPHGANYSGTLSADIACGYSLLRNGNPMYGYDGKAPTVYLDGSEYLYHADASQFDIVAGGGAIDATVQGITAGGWFKFETLNTVDILLAKYTTSGDQRSYRFAKHSDNTLDFLISNTGTLTAGQYDRIFSTGTLEADTWYFLVGRWGPSIGPGTIDVFVDNIKDSQASAEDTIYNSSSDLTIGVDGNRGNPLRGWLSLQWLTSQYLSDAWIDDLWQSSRAIFGK